MEPTEINGRLRVYLDIDGTILFEPGDGTAREDLDFQLVCDGLSAFLQFVVEYCDPRWLSYRTRLGTLTALEQRLFPHLPDIARRIPAADWVEFKHEAIDPHSHFVWFDDDIEAEDMAWLTTNGCIESLIRVAPTNRHNPLLMLNELKTRIERAARITKDAS